MSSLPPYSTFRTDSKQMMYPQAISHGNILTFTPPGFNQILNVKFPDCRLAVCEKCKKNYKTRDMCRVRNSHTGEPWTTAFICITLDDTCTDSNGKYINKPLTVRMVQWQPFCVKKPFDPKTPVCSACKKTNRTRSFCRERHKHRQLPWCTVYVLLSTVDSTDPNTVVCPPSKLLSEEKPENGNKAEGKAEESKPDSPGKENDTPKSEDASPAGDANAEDKETNSSSDSAAEKVTSAAADEEAQRKEESKSVKTTTKMMDGEGDEGDDINDIAESRTFLAKVSCRSNTIHWLELAEFDASEANAVHGLVAPDSNMQAYNAMRAGAPGVAIPAMDPQQAQYYAQAMGYAAQQHQHTLKSNQQYFFQMQQRQQQQYAAHTAWQAQYNQQPGMQVAGQPAAGIPAAAPVPSTGQPAAAPVTAGEAAAQQQKQSQTGSVSQPIMMPQQPPQQLTQPQAGQEQTAGAAAAAAQQQQQANPQWQAQMLYNQHFYNQQQLQMQQQPSPGTLQQGQPGQQQMVPPQQQQQQVAPQQQQQYAPAQPSEIAQAPNGMPQVAPGNELVEPGQADGMNGTGDENVAKRARYV